MNKRISVLLAIQISLSFVLGAAAQNIAVVPLGDDLFVFSVPIPSLEVDPEQTIVVVAKTGGDFSDPIAAMASITDASQDKPYTIYIEPGRYDLDATLSLKDYVSITGKNSALTTIFSTVINDDLMIYDDLVHKTSIVAGNMTSISNITLHVELRGSFGDSFLNVAILNQGTALEIRDTKIFIGGENPVGIRNINSDLSLTGSTVQAATINVSAVAISSSQSSLDIHNSVVSGQAPYGTPAIVSSRDGSPTVISNSKIRGGGLRAPVSIFGKNVLILGSIIEAGDIEINESNRCVDSVGSNGNLLLENCQPLL